MRSMQSAYKLHFFFLLLSFAFLASKANAFDTSQLPHLDVTAAQRITIERLLEKLQVEAQQVLHDQKIPKSEPDIAARFDETIDQTILGIVVLHRAHKDPFIDAYTRWQLLSFEPIFPELSPRQFITFMTQTPPMMEHPRANEQVVALFTRAENAGVLDDQSRARLRELEVEIQHREDIARHLNHPAEKFREWITTQLGATGVLPRLWLLEHCSAVIDAGRSTRTIKMRISREFSNSVVDETFTDSDRQFVALAAEQLAGHKRKYVNSIAYKADGSVDVRFSTAQVTATDIQKWRDRLFDRYLK